MPQIYDATIIRKRNGDWAASLEGYQLSQTGSTMEEATTSLTSALRKVLDGGDFQPTGPMTIESTIVMAKVKLTVTVREKCLDTFLAADDTQGTEIIKSLNGGTQRHR